MNEANTRQTYHTQTVHEKLQCSDLVIVDGIGNVQFSEELAQTLLVVS